MREYRLETRLESIAAQLISRAASQPRSPDGIRPWSLTRPERGVHCIALHCLVVSVQSAEVRLIHR